MVSEKTHSYLKLAAKVAERGMRQGHGGPFGAVIVKKGRVIAAACNTVLKTNDPTRHAEMNAIRIASQKLKTFALTGCEIYSSTEPCPMCFSAIHWAKIERVYYSTVIADVKKLGFNELTISNHKMRKWGKSPVKLTRIANQACIDLLKNWKRLPRRKTY